MNDTQKKKQPPNIDGNIQKFKDTISRMSLKELQVYKMLLDKEIRKLPSDSSNAQPAKAFGLFYYRTLLDAKIKERQIEERTNHE